MFIEIEKAGNIYAFFSDDNEGRMKCFLTSDDIDKLLHIKYTL